MNHLRVICPDCGDTVEHHCHEDLRKAIVRLLTWVPESGVATKELEEALTKAGVENGWIEEGTEDRFNAPFFGSQAWSYPLFGSKDTARTFHALLHNVARAAGVDPDKVSRDYWEKRAARERAEKERKARVKKARDERDEIAAYLKSDAPLEERIKKLDEILRGRAKGLVPYAGKEDEGSGFDHLYKYLDNYYGGGISHDINRARITKLEHEMYETLREEREK